MTSAAASEAGPAADLGPPSGEEIADVQMVVRPVPGGWMVECPMMAGPMAFTSGARAEQRARALAKVLAWGGRDVQLIVEDRQHQVIGAERFFARGG